MKNKIRTRSATHLIVALINLLSPFQAMFAQGHLAPSRPDVPPSIGERYANDADGDRIDDALFVRAIRAVTGESSARTPAEKSQARAQLEELITVELIFKEPVTLEQIDIFASLGGEITYVYRAVSYGWNARIPLNKITAIPTAMGATFVLVEESRGGNTFMNIASRAGRVRPVWANGFAGSPKGFSGNTNITIAFADSGIDDAHTDLVGRGVYWRDYTTNNYLTPTDYDNHGTAVSAIALGTGVASGSDVGPISIIQNGDLTGATSGTGPDKFPMELPTNAITTAITANWNGGGSTTLAFSRRPKGVGGVFGWSGLASTSGVSPLTLVLNLAADPGRVTNNYSPVLLQNSSQNIGPNTVACVISNSPASGDGFNKFRGVAPGCNWAMAKVLDDSGHSDTLLTDLSAAIDDLVSQRTVHNIKVINLSLGLSGVSPSLRQKVNSAVANGIVVVAAAGNSAAPSTDPARAAMALTVAAVSDINQLTDYSSTGFLSPDASAGEDFKPDLAAPGGSRFGYQSWLVSADSGWGDGPSFADQQPNDYRGKWGTSLASPFAAGCAALVIEAMESAGIVWDFGSSQHSSLVKMVLCATASESGSNREGNLNNPSLQRAETGPNGFPESKDQNEGYGMINPDAAVEAISLTYTNGTIVSDALGVNPSERRTWARTVNLSAGRNLSVTLVNPTGGDFDMYLYSATPSASGTPVLLDSSTQAGNGVSETLNYTADTDQRAFLVVKRVSGFGAFNLNGKEAPLASFIPDITAGLAPLTVNFTNLTSGDVTNYLWSLGDGDSSTAKDVSHVYPNAGIYTVSLTATGPGGTNSVTKSDLIVITNLPPPLVSFSASPTEGAWPLHVFFTNTTTGATNYFWDFGDGNTSTEKDAANIYASAGNYSVTLTAVGAGGTNSATLINYIKVSNPPPPTADFTAGPTKGLVPLEVTFTGLATGGTNFQYDFGDGSSSTFKDTVHTYTNPGVYSVTFTVTGPGGTNSLVKPGLIVVTNGALPVVDFVASPATGFAPLTVYFTNLCVGATDYLWDFGDGSVSANAQPANTYVTAGSYAVTLTAVGVGGTNILVRANYVVVTPAPQILLPNVSGEHFSFSFETVTGKIYLVEFKETVEDSTWQTLQSISGDGAVKVINDPLSLNSQRWYRLKVQ